MRTTMLCRDCTHPTVSHGIAGCLEHQWQDETSAAFCPCDLTEDEADELIPVAEGMSAQE